jgi:putative nucleotidyltransferase with HDIG domain
MIEDRDTYTGGHSQRVATYSKKIAKYMNLDDKICENIYQAGILHDIGKIAIPDTILLKPGILDNVEYKLIQEHVSLGVDILNKVPMFEELARYIESHHERYDGSGYPKGLKGDEILLESQIMAVCDVFDAMTTSRIYKSKKTVLEAIKEIKLLEGKHFQKKIVDAAIDILSNITLDESISQLPITELEQERFSYFYKDQITKCYNSNYFDLMLIKNSYNKKYKYLYVISIHNLNNINLNYSWEEGNSYLKNVSLNLQKILDLNEVFRVYSDDFLILTEEKIELNIEQLNEFILRDDLSFNVKSYNIQENKIFSFHDFELLKKR